MTRWTLKFLPGNNFDHFPSGNNRKTVIYWTLKVTEDAELLTGGSQLAEDAELFTGGSLLALFSTRDIPAGFTLLLGGSQ